VRYKEARREPISSKRAGCGLRLAPKIKEKGGKGMFLLFIKGGIWLSFRDPLELLMGLQALTGGIEEVRTVSPRLALIRTFSGDTFSVSMMPPSELASSLRLPVLPFSLREAYWDM
jgi:hypothetical protein